MARIDPHSFAEDAEPRVVALAWRARVDFESRRLVAEVDLELEAPSTGGPLTLDSRGLSIEAVHDDAGRPVAFSLGATDPILGEPLTLTLEVGVRRVRVRYATSRDASALQWLDPQQTTGGQHPFLFSQCQAIHARSVIPLQDTPSRRITFTAELDVPRALRARMGAGFVGREEQGDRAIERFDMPQPIAPYLIALAVGELVARPLGRISHVWAEPAVIDAAAWEFAEIDTMLDAGEALFGPYAWGTFDVLVMPPSFPYGGMENPRLTFVTPTLLAGDRSQAGVVGHELAHAWTGNLVTNATAEHFWLNEGWTRYAELRIVEALAGEETAALERALCRSVLDEALARFEQAGQSALTKLRTRLEGIDPDESFSVVPYDKGALFLQAIEAHVGAERFEAFAKLYLDRFRFRSVTTEAFLELVAQELPGTLDAIDAPAWIDGPGLPANAPAVRSERLERLHALGGAIPPADLALSPLEWTIWLERLPRPQPPTFCAELDARFDFTGTGNLEVKVAWLKLALASEHDAVLDEVERVLVRVGRMKYLKPLYQALLARDATKSRAVAIFGRAASGYHPIARAVLSGAIERAG